ncbi:MAG: AAA-like domain-containing protein, partial [Deinococcales bacterium]
MTKSIFTIGGTVDSREKLYIERKADDELLALCERGALGYVLTSRQMGKSSLMVYAAHRLRALGHHVAILDLSRIGVHLSAEEWYVGILDEIASALKSQQDLLGWWEKHQHLGYTQRFSRYLEQVLLPEVEGRVIIFIDEIDSTLSLAFSDDFFAALRALYNARAFNSDLKRLSFVLFGTATPNDLISDAERTPFNIGERIELGDFSFEQMMDFKEGLPAATADGLLKRVFYWTDGHPYLSQKLLLEVQQVALENALTPVDLLVDERVHEVFFDERASGDSNIDFVKDMLTKRLPQEVTVERLLESYREVLLSNKVIDNPTFILHNHLKLAGIVKRQGECLRVRNA